MTSTTPTRPPKGSPYAGFGWRSAGPLISGYLPSCLVAEEEQDALFSFAEELPGSWYWGMFETRLQREASHTDLLAALVQSAETRREIQSTFSSGGHPALDSARGTLEAWSRDDGSHFARSPNLWFEWDHDRPEAPALQWLCLSPDFFDRKQEALTIEQTIALCEQFMTSAPELHVHGASRTLELLAEKLPMGGKLMSFSSLRPRGREICRAFVRLPRGTLIDWLRSIEWSGDLIELLRVLPSFEVEGEDHFLQVEFAEKVGPYLGLELAQTERGFPRRKSREAWFEFAVKEGWTSEEKARAVLDWQGATPCTLPGDMPVKLLRSFHLKLAMQPGHAPLAKAYLGFYFRKANAALAA